MTFSRLHRTSFARQTRRAAWGAVLGLVAMAGVARADTASGLAEFRTGHYSEAVTAWQQAADQGDAASALYLGVLYDTGFGVPRSAAEALAWYQRAGERGSVSGMVNAAIMLDAGRGTASQPEQAVEWYGRAAAAGSGRAAYNLGLLYEGGAGVAPDRARAIRYFRQAAANGVPEGRAHLQRMGVREATRVGPAKVDQAMADFDQAQRALLARGPAAGAQAAELFRKAAAAGNPLAAYNLGYCYEHGIGVKLDMEAALKWYRRSAATATDPAVRAIAVSGEQNLSMAASNIRH